VLELGAGIGHHTIHFLPRKRYLASDINRHALAYLRNLAVGKPYFEVARIDVNERKHLEALAGQFDTVLCLNLLEHLADPRAALENAQLALEPGGRLIVLVPQGAWLHASLDRAVGHLRRFDRDELRGLLESAGLSVVSLRDFNRLAVPGWLVNGRVLERERVSRVQLKAFNTLCPYLAGLDRFMPWQGLSLIAVAAKAAPR